MASVLLKLLSQISSGAQGSIHKRHTQPSRITILARTDLAIERVRSNLLSRHKTKSNDEYTNVQIEEISQLSVTRTDCSDLSITVPMMPVSSLSLDQPPVVIQSTPQTVHPRYSSELNVPSATSSKQNVNHSCSIESNAHSAASSTHNISESSDSITSSSVSLNVPSFLPTTRGDVAPVVNTVDTTLPHNTPVSHKVKPSGSSVPKFHPKEQNKRKHKSSAKPSDQPRKVSMYKIEQENKNKGDLMSWVKRKLSPEKDADISLTAKQSRSDSYKNK